MFKQSSIVVALGLVTLVSNSALAAPAGLDEAVRAYKARQYGPALTKLKALVQAHPNDDLVHYYLAFCYQALGRRNDAKQEYNWVVGHSRNAALRANAAQGEAALSRLGSAGSSGGGGSGGPPPADATDAAPAAGAAPAAAGKPAATAVATGTVTVQLWYTDWCHYCKEFDPQFEAAQNNPKYRTLKFQKIDAEDSKNAALRDQYGVNSFPRLVYVDASGKVLYNEGRGEFDERLEEFTMKKKK